ncbi:MAG: hypothetical protein V4580_03520 [Bacteroidota bacterium]
MTDNEAKIIIGDHVKQVSKNSSWWFLARRKFYLDFSALLEPYQKEANLPLPGHLEFPHFTMNNRGLDFGDFTYKWDEIFGTGIKEEELYNSSNESVYYRRHLIFCLEDGTIKEYMLGDTTYLRNLLGHFMEQYKLEFYNH